MTLEETFKDYITVTKENSLEAERRLKEMERVLTEKFQESDKRMKETERILTEKFQESDKRMKETERILTEKFQETDRQMKETDKQMKRLMKKSSEFDTNWGHLVESLVQPSVLELFKERGINVLATTNRFIIEKDEKKIMEIDILMRNGDCLILVEVKTTLRIENIKEHIEKRLLRFKEFFPEYKDKKVYGAVAYLTVSEKADEYAMKKGFFVLTFSGKNIICIKNPIDYKPKDYGVNRSN